MLKKVMVRAHELAREMVGDYRCRMALALRQAWKEARKPALTPVQKAEAIADAINNGDREYRAKVWVGKHAVRVYVTSILSRGRRQDVGYIEVAKDGSILNYVQRAGTYFREILSQVA